MTWIGRENARTVSLVLEGFCFLKQFAQALYASVLVSLL